ncbi:RES family NAD+ phosphorylase [Terriglobus saanensis]|uniref:RES domain protein n=1 Tax=Terriglobus saanensis (strain ATCC BAA-1853 / DSM 23119 / SP1PR4) TaxID=401053 RepID=E8UZS6_TERSS|nr:RES family NAD+ phosphorylase [Terriglobus saanensis]ADV81003.1 RES domain protein [Terriglobus saanensis SP1PR4]
MVDILWRISNYDTLDGLGGERADGRWHTAERGKRIAYLAESPALAILETLVNLKGSADLLPDTFQLLEIVMEREIAIGEAPKLASGWESALTRTQAIGDKWLLGRESALLKVPAAVAPYSFNYLLNPLAPDAGHLKVRRAERVAYDRRLFRLLSR